MDIIDRFIIFFCKLLSSAIKYLNLGAGATWPGEIALNLRHEIFNYFLRQKPKIIFVAGTNGKTTTSKMLATILKEAGYRVRRNESGANLDNGVVSGFIKDSSWWGSLKSQMFIFEVDEAALPKILSKISPDMIILLNLFRDQLDRYGEVDLIAGRWLNSMSNLPEETQFLINADDPQLSFLGTKLNSSISYFGLEDSHLFQKGIDHATDSIYCPSCGQKLTFKGTYFSHLGVWTCGKCGLNHPDCEITSAQVSSPIPGTYNIYNCLAAVLASEKSGIPKDIIHKGLGNFQPAFGRMEEVKFQDKKIKILLSKNPTGFNQSLKTYIDSDNNGPLMLVLNDRIPDGRDVSWIWDVDFELINERWIKKVDKFKMIISGDRAYDMGVRIKYSLNTLISKTQKPKEIIQNSIFLIEEDLRKAMHKALDITKPGETLWIMPTYSAMLEVRKILTGKKIL